MSEPEDEPFDFEAECIKVYHDAKSDEVKIKALSLLAKLQPAKPSVKPVDVEKQLDTAAQRAQARMNGGF